MKLNIFFYPATGVFIGKYHNILRLRELSLLDKLS